MRVPHTARVRFPRGGCLQRTAGDISVMSCPDSGRDLSHPDLPWEPIQTPSSSQEQWPEGILGGRALPQVIAVTSSHFPTSCRGAPLTLLFLSYLFT